MKFLWDENFGVYYLYKKEGDKIRYKLAQKANNNWALSQNMELDSGSKVEHKPINVKNVPEEILRKVIQISFKYTKEIRELI